MNLKIPARIIKNHFGFPRTINWGYSLLICSVGTLLTFFLRNFLSKLESFPSITSLVGYSVIQPSLVVLALLLPTCSLFIERKRSSSDLIVDSIGSFSGIGPLILSFISGIGLMLIRVPLHNLSVWLWLRIGRTPVFPAFFYVNDGGSKMEKWLGFVSGTIIPALGVSLFFTGLMWACFSKREKKIASLIIAVSYAIFSLNFYDFLPLFIIALWLCFLRDTAGHVFAPFLALTGSGLTSMFFDRFVKEVDITMVQVYSDIDSTYFYSSLPAFLVGLILLMFFAKSLNEFRESYYTDFTVNEEGEEKRYLAKGINIALICALIIFMVLWVQVLKGDR